MEQLSDQEAVGLFAELLETEQLPVVNINLTFNFFDNAQQT